MIDQADLMSVVEKYRGNAVVVPVERAAVAWPQISTYQQRDVSPSVMGKASSFALGLCLAQPETKVIVFDGDGSLEMNLGSLVTVANKGPQNLYHFAAERDVRHHRRAAHPRSGYDLLHGYGPVGGLRLGLRLRRPGGPGDPGGRDTE